MNVSPAPVSQPAANALGFDAWARWFWPALIITLGADQLTKFAVHRLIDQGSPLPQWIGWAYNTGVAWSMFDSMPGVVALATLVLIPVLALVWWRSFRRVGRFENLAFGLILGGAVGNAIDRIAARAGAFPGVRDFIHVDLGFWPFAPWPMFNLADAGITVGFAVLLLRSFVTPNARPMAAG